MLGCAAAALGCPLLVFFSLFFRQKTRQKSIGIMERVERDMRISLESRIYVEF